MFLNVWRFGHFSDKTDHPIENIVPLVDLLDDSGIADS